MATQHISFTDVGCGNGAMMAYLGLSGRFHSGWGIELQPNSHSDPDGIMRDQRTSARAKRKGHDTTTGIEAVSLPKAHYAAYSVSFS
jgi:hypothetical protein